MRTPPDPPSPAPGDPEPSGSSAPPESSARRPPAPGTAATPSPPPAAEEDLSLDDVGAIDYRKYRLGELRDIRSHIDDQAYPERAAAVEAEIALRLANPGVYEPAQPDTLAWWRRNWFRVMGIVAILFGLAGIGGNAAGMAAIFKAPRPPVDQAPAAGEDQPGEESAAGVAGEGGGDSGSSAAGSAGRSDSAPADARTGADQSAPADPAPEGDGPSGEASVQDDEAAGSGAASDDSEAGPADGAEESGSQGDAAGDQGQTPAPPPLWFQAFSVGGRFAGAVTGLVLLLGAIQLLRRRESGVFYILMGGFLGIGLALIEQIVKGAALKPPPGQLIGPIVGALIVNGLLMGLVRWGNREVFRPSVEPSPPGASGREAATG